MKLKKIRSHYDEKAEKWYFSVIDIIEILTEREDQRTYWKVLKSRLKKKERKKERNETVTICNQLKMIAKDGKNRLTDILDVEGCLRLVQSIPSPKAEPVKQCLAKIG